MTESNSSDEVVQPTDSNTKGRPPWWFVIEAGTALLALMAILVSFYGVNESNRLQQQAIDFDRLERLRGAISDALSAEAALGSEDGVEALVAQGRLKLASLEAFQLLSQVDLDSVSPLERALVAQFLTEIGLYGQSRNLLDETLEVATEPLERIEVLRAAITNDLTLGDFDMADQRREETMSLIDEYPYPVELSRVEARQNTWQTWVFVNSLLGRCAEALRGLDGLRDDLADYPSYLAAVLHDLQPMVDSCVELSSAMHIV